ETFDLNDDYFLEKKDTGEEQVSFNIPSRLNPEQMESLRKIVGAENVLTDDYSRLRVTYGKMMYDLMRLRKKIVEHAPDAVVCPRDKGDVQALMRFCHEEKIPLVPFGGGSGVMRGTECPMGGITVDLARHMNRILELDHVDQTVRVEPGIIGPDLETALNNAPQQYKTRLRYTCGHLPQSFHAASVGGWVVTRGAGQNSTYYGKIEDLVVCQEYITPVGEIITRKFPATATGPNLDQLFIGSEGTYGILVEVTLKIYRYQPENTHRFSYVFRSWSDALAAVREVSQGEFGLPSVFRISDPEETEIGMRLYGVEGTVIDRLLQLKGYKPGQRCLLLGTADGEKGFAKRVAKMVHRTARRYGAMSATGYVTRRWEHGRFLDPYMREDLQDYGIIIDTLECAVNWSNIEEVWREVRAYCKSRPMTICMSHASHFYPQGVNLYFIFIGRMDLDEYKEYHTGIVDHIYTAGGALSHHHGIGRMLAPWYEDYMGSNELELLRAIKKHLDPHNILNPGGTLALDFTGEKRQFFDC
ncbi:MAG TPA: FAD-binding oxidoreductase, partial [Candidatus Limnocylindrales bacterium]|nr:FAD-binding oxidoreductase [Candidatus Limnocylindrales bacterium]